MRKGHWSDERKKMENIPHSSQAASPQPYYLQQRILHNQNLVYPLQATRLPFAYTSAAIGEPLCHDPGRLRFLPWLFENWTGCEVFSGCFWNEIVGLMFCDCWKSWWSPDDGDLGSKRVTLFVFAMFAISSEFDSWASNFHLWLCGALFWKTCRRYLSYVFYREISTSRDRAAVPNCKWFTFFSISLSTTFKASIKLSLNSPISIREGPDI